MGGRGTRYLLYQDKVGALSYDDYKGPNRQYVEQGKLIVYESYKHNDEHLSGSERERNTSVTSGK